MSNTNSIFRLNGVVQHYAWGGKNFIPSLLSLSSDGEKPFAEYWLGAHENASSKIVAENSEIALNQFIQRDAKQILGAAVYHQFGRLPYLLKVLDVKDMLSIQVHPSKASAEEGFERENLMGIPLNAAHRNYKDDNHKPELMVALSPFWLLHGFKSKKKILQLFKAVPELAFLQASFEQGSYAGLYQLIMEMPQEAVNEKLQPLLDRIIPAYQNNEIGREEEHFWAARAAVTFNQPGRIDRGIFSIYIFNIVEMQEGQAIFQDAGIPHAYLEGQNMEIMANSDNVLRGGLTNKHIDMVELLKHIVFEETIPNIIDPVPSLNAGEFLYLSPAADFQLSKIELGQGESSFVPTSSGEVFFVYSGKAMFIAGTDLLEAPAGASIFAPAGIELKIKADPEGVIFRASVPSSHT